MDTMRKYYLDYLRVLGIFAVIIIHVTAPVYNVSHEVGEAGWWFSNVFNSISRFSVPLFVMISGAVLLDKSIKLNEFYRKRSLRLLPPILFWTLFYIGFRLYNGEEIKNILFLLARDGNAATHLWYLTMFACLMIFAPFINMFLNGDKPSSSDLLILLIMMLIFFILNSIANVPREIFGTEINWFKSFPWYISYFIGGYYLDKYGANIKINNISIIIGIVALIAVGIFLNYYAATSYGILKDTFILSNSGPFVFIITGLVFLFARKNAFYLNSNKTVSTIAQASFGMYLIHSVFIYMFDNMLLGYGFSPISQMTIVIISTIILSFISVFYIRKVKALRVVC